ncbi:MAG: hypothetical protein SGI92_25305 [Bryobacteraceae bacterium]|nr:hypothetical protein [Bryobacteraceae bacterium]
MSSFSFDVDTSPMANTLDSVSGHVDAVTGAVAVMQLAVIRQEQLAAEQVCANIERGFYVLIRSQITQKLARLRSEVDSRLVSLRQLSVALTGVRKQMGGDYQMIATRYSNLFDALDKTLRSRVLELDQASAELAARQLPHLLKRLRDSAALYLLSGVEVLPAGQWAISSKIKANANDLIGSIKRNLLDAVELKREMKLVISERKVAIRQTCYLPVLLMEADGVASVGPVVTVLLAGGAAPTLTGSLAIEQEIRSRLAGLRWALPTNRERVAVSAAFEKLLARMPMDVRLQSEISLLYRASEWRSVRVGEA